MTTKTIPALDVWGETYTDVRVQHGHYGDGADAIQLFTDEGELLTDVTVNLSGYGLVPAAGAFFVKNYGENIGLFAALFRAGFAVKTGRVVTFGPFDTTAVEMRLTEAYA
jgi:hypothetical protein